MIGKNLTKQATPCAAEERSFSVSSGFGTTNVIGVTTSLVTVAPREYEGKMGLAVALPNKRSTKPPRQSAARMAQPGLIRAPSIRSFLSKGKLGVRVSRARATSRPIPDYFRAASNFLRG